MGRGERFWQRLTEGADLTEEPAPLLPIVEIAGTARILIENHRGVLAYSREKITVKVKFGCIHVCGSCLELRRMSKEQLIISGRIDGVTLQRRG